MSLRTDLKHAARALVHRPAFSVVVILTIALGVAANASIFSVVNAVLLEPLPVQRPDRLIRPDVRMAGGGEFLISTSVPNYKDWRDRNRTLSSIGLNASRSWTLTGGDRPTVIEGRIILGPFFETLGVPPARGRWITAAETDRGAPPSAVVTDRFVTTRLGAGVDPIGRTITLDGEPFTIVGVMPRSFTFPTPDAEVFLPMGYFASRLCWEERDCSQGAWAVGRLKDGATLAAAQEDFDRIRRELNEQEGGRPQPKPEVHFYVERAVSTARTPLLVLMGAVAFVLLIACANVASLVLARGESRRREVAVRAALGASRGQLVRSLMVESGLLAAVGGVVGLALAWAGVKLLVPLVGSQLPAIAVARIGLNLPVAAFALGAAGLSGLVFGLVPAWRSARAANDDLRHGARAIGGASRQRLRAALVVTEVALSLVLLCGAGLMIKSVTNLRHVDKGFDGRNVLTAEVPLPALRYGDRAKVLAFHDQLLERARALPGVTGVAISNSVPLSGGAWERGVVKEGDDPTVPENSLSVQFHMVSPDYFSILGIPLLAGRLLTDQDRDGGNLVAVIDETMAKRFWPNDDPIGKRVTFEEARDSAATRPTPIYRTVVGVVKNVRHYELETPARVQTYVAAHQSGRAWSRVMAVVVGARTDPRRLAEPLAKLVAELDPTVALDRVATVEGNVEEALGQTRVVGRLLTVFSALAAGLAGLGLFGLLAYTVAQRVREIGVRVALGASVAQVVGLVTRQGLGLAGLGVAVGLAGAVGLTRLLQGVLFEVRPFDPAVFAAMAAGCLVLALGAAWIPARRAARTDPAVVLREE